MNGHDEPELLVAEAPPVTWQSTPIPLGAKSRRAYTRSPDRSGVTLAERAGGETDRTIIW